MGGEALFPRERRGSNFPEGVPNSLGNFTRGCHIHWGPKFPVTPAHYCRYQRVCLELPEEDLQYLPVPAHVKHVRLHFHGF